MISCFRYKSNSPIILKKPLSDTTSAKYGSAARCLLCNTPFLFTSDFYLDSFRSSLAITMLQISRDPSKIGSTRKSL